MLRKFNYFIVCAFRAYFIYSLKIYQVLAVCQALGYTKNIQASGPQEVPSLGGLWHICAYLTYESLKDKDSVSLVLCQALTAMSTPPSRN